MLRIPLKASVIAYADNASWLHSVATIEEIVSLTEHDMMLIVPWLKKNWLRSDVGKYKVALHCMLIRNKIN